MVYFRKIFVLLLCLSVTSPLFASEDTETATESTEESSAPPPSESDPIEPHMDEPRDMGGDIGSRKGTNDVKDSSGNRFLQNPLFEDKRSESALTEEGKKKICFGVKAAYLSYYDKVYKVEKNCQLIELSLEQIYDISKAKSIIQEADGKTLQGFDIVTENKKPLVLRNCSNFNKRYVTFSYVDIYWVENCTKHLFPDWPTYEDHRAEKKLLKEPIIALTAEEFAAIKSGDSLPSAIDAEYKKLNPVERPVIEVLSLDDACKGLLNQHVSYLDDVYFIQPVPKGVRGSDGTHCEKKPITDGYKFTRMYASKQTPLKELTSSQAISIPTGLPMKD